MVLSFNADLSFLQVTGPFAVILAAFMYGIFSVSSKPLVKEDQVFYLRRYGLQQLVRFSLCP